MADFVAVIRKAVDNLSENSRENRAKVYEKARSAIRRQLEAMNPRPSEDMMSRQLGKLDEAIKEVESEHAVALPPDEEETDRLMAELEALVEENPDADQTGPEPVAPPVVPVPVPPVPVATMPSMAEPVAQAELPDNSTPSSSLDTASPELGAPNASDPVQPEEPGNPFDEYEGTQPSDAHEAVNEGKIGSLASGSAASIPLTGSRHDEAFGLGDAPVVEARPEVVRKPARRAKPKPATGQKKRSGMMGWISVGAILLLIGGAGYAAWTQKDALMAMFPGSETGTAQNAGMTATDTSAKKPAKKPAKISAKKPAKTPASVAAQNPATEVAAVDPAQSASKPDGKFTQRLNADGTETNPGPSPAVSDNGPVEGRSVAAQTDGAETGSANPDAPAVVAPDGTQDVAAGTGADEGTDAAEEQPQVPLATAQNEEPLGVAQKMYLYEERLDQQAPAVTEGSVTWSAIPDPENGGPNNLAIRGEVSTSDGFSALITIKKNADRSLPASHIIEVVFALSPEFPGGSINQLQRVSMKQTEQDQGDPLIAVPAQITGDFYMVALNDLSEAVDSNLSLLRDRNWIDIPVVYDSGRRALITIEKGATGSEVFNQVLDVWAAG